MLNGRAPRADDADNPVRVVYAVPAPAEIYHDFEKRFGLKIVEAYGSTETNLIVNSALDESAPGACGRPNPIFGVRVVDEDGREAPDGVAGEIVVSCPDPLLLSAGYDGMPDVTATSWRDGWFHTGDQAVRDGTGALWFQDRIKDSIRRRGENISSYEVERLVNGHPAVAESAAVGAPSELGEEEVRVVVVLRDGATATPEELFLHYAESMPYHMVPRFIDVVDDLPRTPTDKVEKYKLRRDGVGPGTWDAAAAGLADDPHRSGTEQLTLDPTASDRRSAHAPGGTTDVPDVHPEPTARRGAAAHRDRRGEPPDSRDGHLPADR